MFSIITPTHNPKYLGELWETIKMQTCDDWEWVIVPNGGASVPDFDDARVRVVPYNGIENKIGAIKRFAFMEGRGEWLIEADHDDLLAHNCLEELAKHGSSGADFLYSDGADFSPTGAAVTYHDPKIREGWEACGWKFKEVEVDGKNYTAHLAWEPSAAAVSLIYYAPNHVRAWRRDFYHRIGGHNPEYAIADDHELLIRTYLNGIMRRVPKVLYLYRVETNTWASRVDEIKTITYGLMHKNLHALVARECELRRLPKYDLGGGFNAPDGWTTVDLEGGDVTADLRGVWPFEDSSVGAFRASDFLEHLPDKMHTMSEIYRCLAPGGWLLSRTPSALGEGGYCDPTHVSYWVRRSFDYYTDRNVAKYIKNDRERFMAWRLYQTDEAIPYVVADLVSLKGDSGRLPGARNI